MHLVQPELCFNCIIHHGFQRQHKTLFCLNDFLYLLHVDIVFLAHWFKNILLILFVPFNFFTWLLQFKFTDVVHCIFLWRARL